MALNLFAKGRKLMGILAVPAWWVTLVSHRVAAGLEHATVLRGVSDCRTVVDSAPIAASLR